MKNIIDQSVPFTDKQVEDLTRSKITLSLASRFGIRCIDTYEDAAELLGFNPPTWIVPGLAFPYFPEGDISRDPLFWRIKPDTPQAIDGQRAAKYLQPKGTMHDLFIPPRELCEGI